MKRRYIKEELTYTGEQLQSNFAFRRFNIHGDSIIAFCGKCDVRPRAMVDIEDLKGDKIIFSEAMLHFIVEHYESDLEKGVLRQLVLAHIIKDAVNVRIAAACIKAIGTDLYDGDAKLSISVATTTPVSLLIHFGVNISSINTPVKTVSLNDYGIDPVEFANSVLETYTKTTEKIYLARCKVRWVK